MNLSTSARGGFYEEFLPSSGAETVLINLPKDYLLALLTAGHPMPPFPSKWKPRSRGICPRTRFSGWFASLASETSKTHRMVTYSENSRGALSDALVLHGEVNGTILDSGNFLHLTSEGARAAPSKWV